MISNVYFIIARLTFRHILLLIFHTQHTFTFQKGDILLVAEKFDDGWVRGMRLSDLEVSAVFSSQQAHYHSGYTHLLTLLKFQVGFFPENFVAEDTSPIYPLKYALQYACKLMIQRWPLSCDVHMIGC